MSVFRVNLHNFNNGPVDPNLMYSGFSSPTANLPRTAFLQGPSGGSRILSDGDTFTDNNYWKQFAVPQAQLHDAFIEVLSDDGSVYEYSRNGNFSSSGTYPMVYNISAVGGSTYTTTGNSVSTLSADGKPAVFCQITNNGSGAVKIRLNGNINAIFDLPSGHSQVFNAGDLTVTEIEVDNSQSGATLASVQIIASIQS